MEESINIKLDGREETEVFLEKTKTDQDFWKLSYTVLVNKVI